MFNNYFELNCGYGLAQKHIHTMSYLIQTSKYNETSIIINEHTNNAINGAIWMNRTFIRSTMNYFTLGKYFKGLKNRYKKDSLDTEYEHIYVLNSNINWSISQHHTYYVWYIYILLNDVKLIM